MLGLFEPLDIKGLKLKNRIVMAPMATKMATPEGEVTDRHIRHYTARARGGVGLIIVESTYVLRNVKRFRGQLGLCDDKLIYRLSQLVDAVHSAGARVAIQLTHAGSRAPREMIGEQPVGAWDIPVPEDKETPRPLTVPELATIVTAFGEAVRRAVDAGVDAIELHGAHGFLLNQFLSPYTNRRNDSYGGSGEGRLRFPLEVIGEVKRRLAGKALLFYRFGADDMVDGGLTREDARLIAPRLERAGVNVIDVSGGLVGDGQDRFKEQGYFVPLAQCIKEMVTVPVIGVGNITEPEYADGIVREGKVDLVAFGRTLLSNPDFPRFAARRLGVATP